MPIKCQNIFGYESRTWWNIPVKWPAVVIISIDSVLNQYIEPYFFFTEFLRKLENKTVRTKEDTFMFWFSLGFCLL